MLSKVKWPGLDEQPDNQSDISDSEASDIQSYSEEESNVRHEGGSELDHSLNEISEDDTKDDGYLVGGELHSNQADIGNTSVKHNLGAEKNSKYSLSHKMWRKTMDLLHTSTPVQKKGIESEVRDLSV